MIYTITLRIKNETKSNKKLFSLKIKRFSIKYILSKMKIQTKIKEILKNNDHKNTIYRNLWDIFKAVIIEKFITLNIYIDKIKRMVINELNF